MSAYRVALDETTATIDRRARYYRNLIAAVSAMGLGSVVWAVISWTAAPLAGLSLLLPACGLFFFLDSRLLGEWQSGVMEAWVKKEIDFRAFRHAADANPVLPKATLQGMLATLPDASDLVAEQKISSSTREGVAAAVAGMHACQSDAIAWKTTAAAIVCGLAAIAASRRSWEPLAGCAVLILLPVARAWLLGRRIANWKSKLSASLAKPDFSRVNYSQLITRPPWDRP